MQNCYKIVLFNLLFICTVNFAQGDNGEPLIADRPDFTESSETVSLGRVQFETGYTYSRDGIEKNDAIGELLARVGVHRVVELRLGLNSYSISRFRSNKLTGFEDVELGVKIKLDRGGGESGTDMPQFALIGSTTLPTGSSYFRAGGFQPAVKLLAAMDITDRISVGSNINYEYLNEDKRGFSQLVGSISTGVSVTLRLGLYFEYFGFFPLESDLKDSQYLNSGITYLITDDYLIDFRGGIGMNGGDNDYFIGTGAVLRF